MQFLRDGRVCGAVGRGGVCGEREGGDLGGCGGIWGGLGEVGATPRPFTPSHPPPRLSVHHPQYFSIPTRFGWWSGVVAGVVCMTCGVDCVVAGDLEGVWEFGSWPLPVHPPILIHIEFNKLSIDPITSLFIIKLSISIDSPPISIQGYFKLII